MYVYCKRNFELSYYVLFEKGKFYKITSSLPEVMIEIDGFLFHIHELVSNIDENKHNFSQYFNKKYYTTKEVRKFKLEKIKNKNG